MISIRLHETEPLRPDFHIAFPCVRFHFIGWLQLKKKRRKTVFHLIELFFFSLFLPQDKTNGQYLKKSGPSEPTESAQVDFLPPILSSPCKMKGRKEYSASWEEDLVIHTRSETILKENILLMFELLDFKPSQNVDSFFHIAWGFFSLVGTDKRNNTGEKVMN
jgi:hypothetical protein